MQQAARDVTGPVFYRPVSIDADGSFGLQVPVGTGIEDAFNDASCWLASALATLRMAIEGLEGQESTMRECEALHGVARQIVMAKGIYDEGGSMVFSALRKVETPTKTTK